MKRSKDALPTISLLKYQKVQFQLNFTGDKNRHNLTITQQ